MRIVRRRWPMLAIAAGSLMATSAAAWSDDGAALLASFIVIVMLFGAVIAALFFIVRDCREAGPCALLPLLCCVAAFHFSGDLADEVRRLRFTTDLPPVSI